MYRIAVLMVERNTLQKDLLGYLEEELSTLQIPHGYQVEVFEIRKLSDHRAEKITAEVIEHNPDLIITMGNYRSLYIKQYLIQKGLSIPVIATACYDPIGIGLVGQGKSLINNIAVVASQFPKETLPLEVLLHKYDEKIQRFIIIYRSELHQGKIDEVSSAMARFARLQSRETLIMQYNKDIVSDESFRSILRDGDAIVAPITGLTLSEVESIDRIIRRESFPTFLYADNENAASSICGYKASMKPTALHAASYARKILVDGVPPGSLKPVLVKDTAQLAFPNETLTEDEWRLRVLLEKQKKGAVYTNQ